MLAFVPALLIAASTVATPCSLGAWDLKAGDQIIFRVNISTTMATWERPAYFETDGESFSRIKGPMVSREARSVRLVNGDIELSFDDPAPGASPDIFRLHCTGSGHLDITYQGTGFEPFDFVRGQVRQPAVGPWDAGRDYVVSVVRPTNVEMAAIFDADQADRRVEKIDWSVVDPADAKRRIRTQELLDLGLLRSGDDFYHAAFIFQHGSLPGDYLKAHLLAMIAVARGSSGALWIASATLDRYLQTIGKPQVLGTQFQLSKGVPATQEPYDRSLVSDTIRQALKVPPISEQEERRRKYTEDATVPQSP